MRISKMMYLILQGALWFGMGVFLLVKSIRLLAIDSVNISNGAHPIVSKLSPFTGGPEQAVLILISVGLFLGFVKGRVVLPKTVKRTIDFLAKSPANLPLHHLFPIKHLFLILGMISLGMILKIMGIPTEIRGTILLAVGSGLVHASLLYFRHAFTYQKLAH